MMYLIYITLLFNCTNDHLFDWQNAHFCQLLENTRGLQDFSGKKTPHTSQRKHHHFFCKAFSFCSCAILCSRAWSILECQLLICRGGSSLLICKTLGWSRWSCACQEILIWNPLTLTVSASTPIQRVKAQITYGCTSHSSLFKNNLRF